MLESHPSNSPGTFFGFVLIAGLVLLDLGLLLLVSTEPVTFLTFIWGALVMLSFPAIAFIAYWTSSLSATRYHVVKDAVLIEWGRLSQTVPLAQISTLIMGEGLAGVKKFRGLRWPGCFVGTGLVNSLDGSIVDQDTLFFATRPLNQQLLLVTKSVAYGLSPIDLENFKDCLEALLVPDLMGSDEKIFPDLDFLNWRLWRDRSAQLVLAMAVILNGALFAYLCAIFNRLPSTIPLHFNRLGVVDRVESPINLFVLPLLGLFTWIVNGAIGWLFYQKQGQQPMAYVLWGSSILVQMTVWSAFLGLFS